MKTLVRDNPHVYPNGRAPQASAAPGTAPDSKLPPFSEDAEQNLIGAVLNDNGALPLILAKGVTTDSFFVWKYRQMFAAMLELYERGQYIDKVTLADKLQASEVFEEIGGELELMRIEDSTLSSFAAPSYAEIVRAKAERRSQIDFYRQALTLLGEASCQVFDEATPPELTPAKILEILQPIAKAITSEQSTKGATWAELEKLIGPVVWAWPGWLPIGLLSMIVAESGAGKSAMALKVSSCFLRGDNWPDGTQFTGQTGSVLWCEAEAAQAVNLDRAKKWGLPIEKLLSPLDNPLDDFQLDNPEHQAALVSKARRDCVKFIVVDSLSGGTRRDGKKANEMMITVKFLAELARDVGKPVLLTHHLRKRGLSDGDKITLDRVRDSSAIVQPARVIWALDAPDPADEANKRLSVIKSNIAKFPVPIGLTVSESGITFGDAPEPPKRETLQGKAADLLLSLLTKTPKPATKLQEEFEQAGISWHAANRAKEKLGVVSAKIGGIWHWSLPIKGPGDEIAF